jgi:hypothetical protein
VKVYFDTNCIIYFIENKPAWFPKVVARLAALRSARDELAVGDLARAECLVGPFKSGDAGLEARYRAFFGDGPADDGGGVRARGPNPREPCGHQVARCPPPGHGHRTQLRGIRDRRRETGKLHRHCREGAEMTDPVERSIVDPPPPFWIKCVRLRDYRSIAFCDVSLEPMTVLVGRNGAGKSNFLDALTFVGELSHRDIRDAINDHGGPDGLLNQVIECESCEIEVMASLNPSPEPDSKDAPRTEFSYRFRYFPRRRSWSDRVEEEVVCDGTGGVVFRDGDARYVGDWEWPILSRRQTGVQRRPPEGHHQRQRRAVVQAQGRMVSAVRLTDD